MITAAELKTKIMDTTLSKKNGWKKRVDMLKACELYLLSNPSPEFIEKEFKRVSESIRRRDQLFHPPDKDRMLPSYYSALKSLHDKEYGTDLLQDQLETLAIILQKDI